MVRNNRLKLCTTAAIFAAIIFVATMYIKIPLPQSQGYVHIGDAIIFLCACLLPMPYAATAAVIGSSFADIFGGAPIWVPATIIIKMLTAFAFTGKSKKILSARNIIALFIAAILCAGGYYLYEAYIIVGDFLIPVAYIPFNLAQTAVSAVIFVVLAIFIEQIPALRKIREELLL